MRASKPRPLPIAGERAQTEAGSERHCHSKKNKQHAHVHYALHQRAPSAGLALVRE